MTASTWTLADIPDLAGQRALVTGVTSGIGEVAARELARRGATVVLAARSPERLAASRDRITRAVPDARLVDLIIDLSDQASIRHAAGQVADPVDILINNAGVMATPYRRTPDGFELQLATNHLGPFLLTGLLMERLVDGARASGRDSRVVAVSSVMHRTAVRAPLRDPHAHRLPHSRWHSYGQSKLANLLFTYDLDRRLRERGLPVRALAAHPGYAVTELVHNGHGKGPVGTVVHTASRLAGQSAERGALPILMAATADLPGSSYVGPAGPGELQGDPQLVGSNRLSHDQDAQRRLWELSQAATGVTYP